MRLSSQNYPTLSLVCPELKKLRKVLVVNNKDTVVVKKMKDKMIKKLNDKFGNEDSVTVTKAMVATALDPRYKSLKSLDHAQREMVKDEVVKMVKMSMDAGVNDIGIDGPPSKRVRLSQSSSSSSDEDDVTLHQSTTLYQAKQEYEVITLFSIDANNIGVGGSKNPNSMYFFVVVDVHA